MRASCWQSRLPPAPTCSQSTTSALILLIFAEEYLPLHLLHLRAIPNIYPPCGQCCHQATEAKARVIAGHFRGVILNFSTYHFNNRKGQWQRASNPSVNNVRIKLLFTPSLLQCGVAKVGGNGNGNGDSTTGSGSGSEGCNPTTLLFLLLLVPIMNGLKHCRKASTSWPSRTKPLLVSFASYSFLRTCQDKTRIRVRV